MAGPWGPGQPRPNLDPAPHSSVSQTLDFGVGHTRDEFSTVLVLRGRAFSSSGRQDSSGRWSPSLGPVSGKSSQSQLCCSVLILQTSASVPLPFRSTSVSPELPRPQGPVPWSCGCAPSFSPGCERPARCPASIRLSAAHHRPPAYLRPPALRPLQSANENLRTVVRVSHQQGLEVKSPVRAGFLPTRLGWLFLLGLLPRSEILTALGRPVPMHSVSEHHGTMT